jgi:hypothetical protein
MFDYLKKIAISGRTDDELLYEFVLSEMENGVVAKGLWGKALANSGGDNANAKSIYMKYRVQSIKDIFTSQKIAYNELSKPILFQYIEDKIFPMTNDYTNLTLQVDAVKTENYSVSKDEEALYEEVANELSKNIRKEGLWLKAIQNTDGNENKALALYIKYRSEAIKAEKKELINQDMRKKQRLEEEKQLEEKILYDNTEGLKNSELMLFLSKNNMLVLKTLEDGRVLVNYSNTPVDVHMTEYPDTVVVSVRTV